MKYNRCSAAIKSWIIEYMYFQSMLKAPSWMLKATSNFNSLKSCSLYFSPTPVRARATVHQDIPAPAWALHGLQFLGEITTCTVNGVLHGLQSVYLLHHGVLQRNLCPGACSTFSPCSSLRLVSCRAVSHPFSWLPGSIFLFFFFSSTVTLRSWLCGPAMPSGGATGAGWSQVGQPRPHLLEQPHSTWAPAPTH